MECVAPESQILTCQQLRRVPPPIPASLPPFWALQGLSGQSYHWQPSWKEDRPAWEVSGQGLIQLRPSLAV